MEEKKFKCNLCERPINHRGNCLSCNYKLKYRSDKPENAIKKECIKCGQKFLPQKDYFRYCNACFQKYMGALNKIEKDPFSYMESINPLAFKRIRENMKKILSKKNLKSCNRKEKEQILDQIRKIESK